MHGNLPSYERLSSPVDNLYLVCALPCMDIGTSRLRSALRYCRTKPAGQLREPFRLWKSELGGMGRGCTTTRGRRIRCGGWWGSVEKEQRRDN